MFFLFKDLLFHLLLKYKVADSWTTTPTTTGQRIFTLSIINVNVNIKAVNSWTTTPTTMDQGFFILKIPEQEGGLVFY